MVVTIINTYNFHTMVWSRFNFVTCIIYHCFRIGFNILNRYYTSKQKYVYVPSIDVVGHSYMINYWIKVICIISILLLTLEEHQMCRTSTCLPFTIVSWFLCYEMRNDLNHTVIQYSKIRQCAWWSVYQHIPWGILVTGRSIGKKRIGTLSLKHSSLPGYSLTHSPLTLVLNPHVPTIRSRRKTFLAGHKELERCWVDPSARVSSDCDAESGHGGDILLLSSWGWYLPQKWTSGHDGNDRCSGRQGMAWMKLSAQNCLME